MAGGLSEFGRHLRVMAYDRFPDIPGLIASIQRLVHRLAPELGVDDISRVGIRVSEVILKPRAQFGNPH